MLQKLVLAIAVFLAALLALSFGQAVLAQIGLWLGQISHYFIRDFGDFLIVAQMYISANWLKLLLAALITAGALVWINSTRKDELEKPGNHRKIAIILAVLLGWLGGHRFYLGQVGWGLIYLLLCLFSVPLVVFISLVDAVRYAFMTDSDFSPKR